MSETAPEVTIYSARRCPFAQRSRLALTMKGVPFAVREIDLKSTPAWFAVVSPYEKVPVLEHGEHRVWESAIINEYIEEVFPEPALLPHDPAGRAYARFWIDHANVRFVPLFYKLLLAQDCAAQARLVARLREELRFMDQTGLGGPRAGRFWLGEAPGLVDITYYPFFERYCALEHYRGFRIPRECARILHWLEAMAEVPAVRALAHGPEFHIRSYAHYADGTASGSTAEEMRES